MYNNMQYNPYSYPNMYQNNYQYQQPNMQQQNPNQNYRQNIPQNQPEDVNVPKVDGIDGAYQCYLPGNVKSTIALDIHKPLCYVITVDGINRQVTPYNISEYKDPQEELKDKESNILEALNNINSRLDSFEERIGSLESNKNVKQQNNKR